MTTVTITDAANTVVVTEGNGDTAIVTSPSPAVLVETTGLGPQGPGGVVALYGSFTDTTDQPLVSTSAAQPITINTTLENRGVTIVSNSRITFELAGTYKVFASVQATNFSNNTAEIDFFLKKNGNTLANSNKTIDLDPRKSIGTPFHDRITFEYQLTVATNDYVELWWTADHIDIILKTLVASATHPQAACATVNVAQVMYAQANAAPRSVSIIGPVVNDTFTVFRTDTSTTLSAVTALVSGVNPSVSYEIRYASDRTLPGTLAITPATATNTTTGSAATVQNQPIPANSYVWLTLTAIAGTVGEMNVTLAF
jgi:hypothetical protein